MVSGEDGQGGQRSPHGLPEVCSSGMLLLDQQARIVQVNREAEALLGVEAADLLDQDAHDRLHRDRHGHTIPRSSCPLQRAFHSSRPAQGQLGWYERGDGTLLPVCWFITPCRISAETDGAMVLFYTGAPDDGTGEQERPAEVTLPELDRLALLAETTTSLTSTFDVHEALHRLTRLLVPRLADWAVIDLLTEGDEVWRAAVVHHEGDRLVDRKDLQGPMPPLPQESVMPLSRALRGAASTLAVPETYQGPPDAGIAVAQRKLFEATGMHSAAIAPIRGVREVLGALTLGQAERAERFSDLSLLEDIARRAGLALENARLFQRQRRVTETMQRHLLPQLPREPRLEMAARYVAAPEASEVGGDWYDAFFLQDGNLAVATGDVLGHDADAAAAMAQVRNMLRAYAWSYQEPPSAVVDRLDQAVQHMTDASLATLVFARVESDTEGRQGGQVRWTNAGHPPPLLVTHDGRARFLDSVVDPLIGADFPASRQDAAVDLPPLSTLVFYTDGLIESRGHSLDEGLDRLSEHAAALARRPLDTFCDLLLNRVRPADNDDDVALLALRRPARTP
ncbi:SpoIIE family protein phosphatase [Streptomyces smyrnaeus]|uniref:SpoIIE family protein phosphatase n=1 Tax=Streptomyces TaxID=1883 RepID=UPI000C19D378|nr:MULTISPECIES: SpoIIE family protein phosphatase [unclassified Streptomyces]MBQ0863742.1 SpoIIE family protein phosphatase [Streptomyces sp. RK75]MBQ1120202.1 SpoIIE family protein phosphatase [Streptomyces sp. B15]MBQ1156581.1 SpoIIE family protein phosphatase [Streptomyces sp. A73]